MRKGTKHKKAKLVRPASRIESMRHRDKRANIPTRELAGFVAKEEEAPYELTYPRDTSLDPQLVWKGKDKQDKEPLKVIAVPIYIQEKVAPQAIIEDLLREQRQVTAEEIPDLFSDFDGIAFEKLVQFYKHEQNWTNRMILGDSLLVMNSLVEKEALKGKVQMVFVDPPYGIEFRSNWQVSTRRRDVKDGKVEDATRQPEQIQAFRDTWKDGINSYLAYLRDRFVVARELLTESGSIFLQIGDGNVHLVRSLLDEVFGSDGFVSMIAFTKAAGGLESTSRIGSRLDYLLWYAKNRGEHKYRPLYKERLDPVSSGFTHVELPDETRRPATKEELRDETLLPKGTRLFRPISLTKPGPGSKYTITVDGHDYDSGNRWWGSPKQSVEKLIQLGRVAPFGNTLRYISYHDDFPLTPLSNLWEGIAGATDPRYVVQTNEIVIERCIMMSTDPGDLVLDPTCGSGTVAYVAEQFGRRWITIDTSRVALALARTRMMSARYPYYLLKDSPEGIMKEAELSSHLPPTPVPNSGHDIRKGFVYRRVPHVTLRSIANNSELSPGMARDALRAAILRKTDVEYLCDQPLADQKRIRVAGLFTVESLSPHRVISTDQERPRSERRGTNGEDSGTFEAMILENLKRAGVQNTMRKERLIFERLEPHAGVYVQAVGEYEENGKQRRAAICIGPEHGTVGPELLKEAAKEAVKGVGFDLLVVCGFAFDPLVSEEAKDFGKLSVLMARMNADLGMGDELLKKTGTGNLFMVFGEPDIRVERTKGGKIVVEIRGLDVYDPTTGQIRSHTTDDIACWFIDTDYNGESFFVRHAYFCGADEPFEKLKKALRAEINEAAWGVFYSTKSRPFDSPERGKIGIKVINHYGDEVLKVLSVHS